MDAILKSVASAILAYTAHYSVAKIYNFACVPNGILGYLSGMISAGSPVCQASVQVLSNTQVSYSSMITMGITRIIVDFVAPGSSTAIKWLFSAICWCTVIDLDRVKDVDTDWDCVGLIDLLRDSVTDTVIVGVTIFVVGLGLAV